MRDDMVFFCFNVSFKIGLNFFVLVIWSYVFRLSGNICIINLGLLFLMMIEFVFLIFFLNLFIILCVMLVFVMVLFFLCLFVFILFIFCYFGWSSVAFKFFRSVSAYFFCSLCIFDFNCCLNVCIFLFFNFVVWWNF